MAMVKDIPPSTALVGLWSAVLATVFSVTYDVGRLAEWLGWLGSGGGAKNLGTPFGLVILLTPSLFLGASFLLLMVSVDQVSSPDRRIWSHGGVAFATVYAVLVSMNYFVQLTWVAPRLARGQTQGIEAFLFVPFDSFLYSVDILGYSFMSLATLLAARVFTGGRLERVARAFLTANGLSGLGVCITSPWLGRLTTMALLSAFALAGLWFGRVLGRHPEPAPDDR